MCVCGGGSKILSEILRCPLDPNTVPLRPFSGSPPCVWWNLTCRSSSRLGRPQIIWPQLRDSLLSPVLHSLCSGPLASVLWTTSQRRSCSDPECVSSVRLKNVSPSLQSCSNVVSPWLREQHLSLSFFLIAPILLSMSAHSSQLTLQHLRRACLTLLFYATRMRLRGSDFVHCYDPVLARERHSVSFPERTKVPLDDPAEESIVGFCLYHHVQ